MATGSLELEMNHLLESQLINSCEIWHRCLAGRMNLDDPMMPLCKHGGSTESEDTESWLEVCPYHPSAMISDFSVPVVGSPVVEEAEE